MNNRIILIENDPAHVELIKYILSDDGFEVFDSDPLSLFEAINKIDPFLILMDRWLDNDSGAEICKELKENTTMQNIPVILISASIGLEQIAQECHADGYIEKPFDIDVFIKVVKDFVKRV